VELVSQVREGEYGRNVRRVFSALFFAISLTAVTLGPLFDAYLLNIGGEKGNALVGAVESTRGLLQLALAYPIGLLSDRMSRTRLLKCVLPLWTTGLILVVLAVLSQWVPLIFVGIAIWAPCSQCWNSTAQVVVAESLPPSGRTKAVANMTSLRLLAVATGPLLQMVLLLVLGKNHWGTSLLRTVILAGVVLWPGVLFWTTRLHDLPPLEKAATGSRSGSASCFRSSDLDRLVCGMRLRWWVAGAMELISVVTAVGAGMTVKFFPLFFRVDYHFTPLEVCALSFIYPLSISLTVQVCRRVSKRLGRLRASVLFHWMATVCLWAMCYCRSIFLVLPLYIVRGALMNARGPINRAIIMDLVTSEVRGRWNSFQSISTFTWSGSAALGGYLADLGGDYRLTFVVTAWIYTFSGLLSLSLFLIFPEEQPAGAPEQPTAASAAPSTSAAPGGRGPPEGSELRAV